MGGKKHNHYFLSNFRWDVFDLETKKILLSNMNYVIAHGGNVACTGLTCVHQADDTEKDGVRCGQLSFCSPLSQFVYQFTSSSGKLSVKCNRNKFILSIGHANSQQNQNLTIPRPSIIYMSSLSLFIIFPTWAPNLLNLSQETITFELEVWLLRTLKFVLSTKQLVVDVVFTSAEKSSTLLPMPDLVHFVLDNY